MEVHVCLTLTLLSLPLLVRVSSGGNECPTWFTLDISNDSLYPQCVCSEGADTSISCNQRERTSYMKLGHCIFQDEKINATVATSCPYIFPLHLLHNGLIRLPHNTSDLNNFICGHIKRNTGELLCGRCTNSTGPSIYSIGRQCVSCSRLNILYYLLLQYVPNTITFLAIILFRFSLVTPPMAHYILYCNIVALVTKGYGVHTLIFPDRIQVVKILLTLNSLWTFDPLFVVSPPVCISENFDEIYIPILDTVAALYPFTLLLLTYILIELHARDCKPITVLWKLIESKCDRLLSRWNSDKSLIQAFATLFFLSFMKFIGIVIDPLLLSSIINMQNEVVAHVSFIDPTVPLFSNLHLLLISLSAIILIIILTPPILLLVLYPTSCFRKISKCLKPRRVLTLKIFSDTFHGSYKDGTNGTRDYRQISGVIFLMWIIFPVVNGIVALMANITFTWLVPFISLAITLSIACAVFEPYRCREANVSGTVLPIILAAAAGIYSTLNIYHYSRGTALLCIAVLTLPHCVFYGYGIYRTARWLKQCGTTNHEAGSLCRLLRKRDYQVLHASAGISSV